MACGERERRRPLSQHALGGPDQCRSPAEVDAGLDRRIARRGSVADTAVECDGAARPERASIDYAGQAQAKCVRAAEIAVAEAAREGLAAVEYWLLQGDGHGDA